MRQRYRGFTLIEILIVIGLLMLLMGLFAPALVRAQEQARRLKCLNNMSQIGKAMLVYAFKNDGELPGNKNDVTSKKWDGGSGTIDWDSMTEEQKDRRRDGIALIVEKDGAGVGTPVTWKLDKQILSGAAYQKADSNREVFVCPTYEGNNEFGGDQVALHYAIPTRLAGMPPENGSYAVGPDTDGDGTDDRLRHVPIVVEPLVRQNEDNSWDNDLASNDAYDDGYQGWAVLPDGGWEGSDRLAARRHFRATNMGFLDGHAESVEFDDAALDVSADEFTMHRTTGGSVTFGGTNGFGSWNN
jgi:prepilin-type processing-associated H-X9-DG protein